MIMHSILEEINRKLRKMDDDNISSEVFKDLDRVRFPLDYFYKSTLSSVQPQSLQAAIQKDSGCANSDGTSSNDILHSQNLNLLLKFAPIELPPKFGQSQAPRNNHEDKIPKEFLENLGDFCVNKVPSAGTDLKKLVEDWNNRNNVQKSFKEKKEQLKELGLRYEKFEIEIENSMKEAKILEKALEMMQTQDEKEISSASIDSKHFQELVNTTSSGMTRTIMEASGTRLDNEELKNTPLNHNKVNFETVALEENSTPVSAPKPVKTEVSTNRSELLATVKEKPMTRPDTLSVNKELPPSSLSVTGVEENYEGYVIVNADENKVIDHNDQKDVSASCTLS